MEVKTKKIKTKKNFYLRVILNILFREKTEDYNLLNHQSSKQTQKINTRRSRGESPKTVCIILFKKENSFLMHQNEYFSSYLQWLLTT